LDHTCGPFKTRRFSDCFPRYARPIPQFTSEALVAHGGCSNCGDRNSPDRTAPGELPIGFIRPTSETSCRRSEPRTSSDPYRGNSPQTLKAILHILERLIHSLHSFGGVSKRGARFRRVRGKRNANGESRSMEDCRR